jgi:hypothetical protein
MQVIGVPLGSGSCRVRTDSLEPDSLNLSTNLPQEVMGESARYERMKSETEALRLQQLEREKLIKRCTFMNTLAETLGV